MQFVYNKIENTQCTVMRRDNETIDERRQRRPSNCSIGKVVVDTLETKTDWSIADCVCVCVTGVRAKARWAVKLHCTSCVAQGRDIKMCSLTHWTSLSGFHKGRFVHFHYQVALCVCVGGRDSVEQKLTNWPANEWKRKCALRQVCAR